MNLEEMLRQERDDMAPNPLLHRTDDIISRVRRRRRGHAAATGVVSLAVVAVLALGARQLLPHQTVITPAGKPTAPSQTVTPPPAVPARNLPEEGQLNPGRYLVGIADGPETPPLQPVRTVPKGYEVIPPAGSDWLVMAFDSFGGQVASIQDWETYVWVWDVATVYTHPCNVDANYATVGPSVADLANALIAQPSRPHTAAALPVTVGGYHGLYLELRVPAGIKPKACPSGGFMMWPGRGQTSPGQVDMVWILDVNGHRIVIDGSVEPNVDPAKVAELKHMVTTTTFQPNQGP